MIRKNNRGFSLLELLIVVAIILIIATIAIPSLLRSRQAANESAAVANIRTINTAMVTYSAARGGSFGTLNNLSADGLLDARFTNGGVVSGYTLTATSGFGTYTVTAAPAGTSGRCQYIGYEDGVVKYNGGAGCPGTAGNTVQ